MAIPPAWTDVWICSWCNGQIQAVGTDAAGRRQYRYHDQWRIRRDSEKFEQVRALHQRCRTFRVTVRCAATAWAASDRWLPWCRRNRC